jgi:hypothetical protein
MLTLPLYNALLYHEQDLGNLSHDCVTIAFGVEEIPLPNINVREFRFNFLSFDLIYFMVDGH